MRRDAGDGVAIIFNVKYHAEYGLHDQWKQRA